MLVFKIFISLNKKRKIIYNFYKINIFYLLIYEKGYKNILY